MARKSHPMDSTPEFPVLRDHRLQIHTLPSASRRPPQEPGSTEGLDLKAMVDQQRIQSIMDDFHALTGMVTAILDLEGQVLESTGWQDLCSQFHREHPVTARHCRESDLALADGLKPGQYADYLCKNGLRDVVTPLHIRGRHVGNIFTGQFFYDDDVVDEEYFLAQAREHGFDTEEYMAALRRIPRYSRETIAHLMSFLVGMTEHISQIGLANLELAEMNRQRQEAETGWHDSRRHLLAVMRAIPDLVWMKDPEGVYLLCNHRFEQFFGHPANEIIGRRDTDFLTPEQAEFFRAHDRRAIERGQPTMNIEEVEFAEDGHRETLETIKTPLMDENGQLSGVLGIGRDITPRIKAEQALRENEEKMRDNQRMESIGRLAAGVAHDLNNLLTPILGYTEIVSQALGRQNPQTEHLDRVAFAGQRARDLVAQLLAFGRRQTLRYRTLDLNEAARNLRKLLSRSLRTNIRLTLQLDEALPPVRADIGQIEQVIMNLALNAADAMPDGGDLRITTGTLNCGEIAAALGPGPCVILTVSDTGSGMDEETLAHVFEPFYSTKGQMGTGLGLATVHGIVKQHGGEITVTSTPGEGSTFCMHLPAMTQPDHPETPAPETGGQSPRTDARETATILVVEDNEDVRAMAATILERQGYHILQAASGEEALTMLQEADPPIDLLLTDVIMPGISGKELHDRALEWLPELPVLFMSGFTDMEFSLLGDGLARQKFLGKPFTSGELVTMVQDILRPGGPED